MSRTRVATHLAARLAKLGRRLPCRWLRGPLVALSMAGALSAQGHDGPDGEAGPGPGPRSRPADRFASWVTSRELLYPSVDDRGEARLYSGRIYFPSPWLGRKRRPVPLVVYVHGTTDPDEIPQFNRGDEVMVGALAAVKEWHLNPRYADLPLTAAACMAGPFHFSESTRAFLTEAAPYQRPDIQVMLLRAYHDLYPESGVFAPERAMNDELLEERGDGPDRGSLLQWLDGSCSAALLRRKIQHRLGRGRSTRASDIMNPEWLQAHLQAPAWPHTEVGRRLRENDLVGGWHPSLPILLAASPTDECVPASNTYALLKDWRERGCTAPVQFHPLTVLGRGMSHATAGSLAVERALRWFSSSAVPPPGLRSRL